MLGILQLRPPFDVVRKQRWPLRVGLRREEPLAPGKLFAIGTALSPNACPTTAVALDECTALIWPDRLRPDFIAGYEHIVASAQEDDGDRAISAPPAARR